MKIGDTVIIKDTVFDDRKSLGFGGIQYLSIRGLIGKETIITDISYNEYHINVQGSAISIPMCSIKTIRDFRREKIEKIFE